MMAVCCIVTHDITSANSRNSKLMQGLNCYVTSLLVNLRLMSLQELSSNLKRFLDKFLIDTFVVCSFLGVYSKATKQTVFTVSLSGDRHFS